MKQRTVAGSLRVRYRSRRNDQAPPPPKGCADSASSLLSGAERSQVARTKARTSTTGRRMRQARDGDPGGRRDKLCPELARSWFDGTSRSARGGGQPAGDLAVRLGANPSTATLTEGVTSRPRVPRRLRQLSDAPDPLSAGTSKPVVLEERAARAARCDRHVT